MKKKLLLIVVIMGSLCVFLKTANIAFAKNVEAKKIASAIEENKEESTVLQTTTKYQADFSWINEVEDYSAIIGTIESKKVNISAPLTLGGHSNEILNTSCGIHKVKSNDKHLAILGHNCEKTPALKDKLFTNLKYLEIGDRVEIKTIYGEYVGVVTDTIYVTPEEYARDDYAALSSGGDVSMAACEYRGEEKGRRIVYLDVVEK